MILEADPGKFVFVGDRNSTSGWVGLCFCKPTNNFTAKLAGIQQPGKKTLTCYVVVSSVLTKTLCYFFI